MKNIKELEKRMIEEQMKFITDTPENRVYVMENFDKIPSNAILLFKIFKEKIEDLEARIKQLEGKE